MLKILFFLTSFISFTDIYHFSLTDADGGTINLSDFKGEKILLVNIATSSKYSNQCKSLEQLYQKYKDSLVVIAIPSNSFGNEPKTNKEIKEYLKRKFNSHFIIAGKINVSGADQSLLYKWLTHISENQRMENQINDDFWKFLIDESGNLRGTFVSSVDPMDEAIQSAVQMHN